MEDRGIHIPVADLYDRFADSAPTYEWGGRNVSVAGGRLRRVRIWSCISRRRPMAKWPTALSNPGSRRLACHWSISRKTIAEFATISRRCKAQPRRILTSPCGRASPMNGRPYSAYCQNIERLVPWRTLTGRQHLYLDHEGYLPFGENLPTFKPRITLEASLNLVNSVREGKSIVLNCLTPHGKWHIHTTYSDNLRMLTLSRGIEPFWLNDKDAAEIGVEDNDWVEALQRQRRHRDAGSGQRAHPTRHLGSSITLPSGRSPSPNRPCARTGAAVAPTA